MTIKKASSNSIAQTIEAKLAKQLAGNEKVTRDRGFKKLKDHVFSKCSEGEEAFSRDEMLRLWKGLFYCMWMSDKPLVQEELAQNMAEILPAMDNCVMSKLYFETFIATMEREWHGIDRLRMEKFYLLIRFMVQQTFVFLKNNLWVNELLDWFLSFLKKGPASPNSPSPNLSRGSPLGLRYHVIDIYLEELINCGSSSLTSEKVTKFMEPYCELVCATNVQVLRMRTISNIFQEMIEQSDAVLGMVDLLEADEVPRLNYDYSAIADKLLEKLNRKSTKSINRKPVSNLIQRFRDTAEGRVSLKGIPDVGGEDVDDKTELKKAEDDLAESLFHEREANYRKRKMEKKALRKETKKLKRSYAMPFQNSEFDKDVEFDRIAEAQGDDGSDDEFERGNERKTRKRKTKRDADEPQKVKKSSSGGAKKKLDSSNLNIAQMMSDLVETPCDSEDAPKKRKLASIEVPEVNFLENSVDTPTSRPDDERKSRNSGIRTRKKAVCLPPDVAVLSKLRSKKSNSKRLQRMKLKEALKKKLYEDEQQTTDSKTAKKSSSTSLVSENISSERATNKINKKNTFKKVKVPKMATPKKVSFEMSKIQVQRFRKTDKSMVLSPSPSAIPFDPQRTPDFGLLKKKSSFTKGRKRKKMLSPK